ncbi:MAG: glycosyltransferase family 4 protein [Patescibacteria group bacterium]
MGMRVGILTNTYPPNLNGVSLSVKNLVEKLRESGVDVFVATPRVEGVEYPDYVYPFRCIPMPKSISPDLKIPVLFTKEVMDFFEEKQIQILHSHETFWGGLEGAEIARKLNIPAVHTYHTYIEQYSYFDVPGYKLFIRSFSKQVCNQYDLIITLSTKLDNYLKKLKIKTPRRRMLNIFDFSLYQNLPKNAEFKKQLGFNQDDFVCLTFCRVAQEKGIIRGINAIKRLSAKYPKIKYLVAGDGPELEDLKFMVGLYNIEDRVKFFGRYKPSDITSLASVSDLFLFTSTTENLPTNLLEAVACGLPVVSVEDSSTEFVFKNGVNGLACPEDALEFGVEALYNNPDLRDIMADNSIKIIEQLKLKDMVNEYMNLYQDMIDQFNLHPHLNRSNLEDFWQKQLNNKPILKDWVKKILE